MCVCLQRKSFSAVEGQALAAMTITPLKSMRADYKFALFCKDITTLADNNLVTAPCHGPMPWMMVAWHDDGAYLS